MVGISAQADKSPFHYDMTKKEYVIPYQRGGILAIIIFATFMLVKISPLCYDMTKKKRVIPYAR